MQQKELRVYGTDRQGGFVLVGRQLKVDIAPKPGGGIVLGSDGQHFFKGRERTKNGCSSIFTRFENVNSTIFVRLGI